MFGSDGLVEEKLLKTMINIANKMTSAYEQSAQNNGLRHIPNDAYFKAKSKLAKLMHTLDITQLKYVYALCIIAEDDALGINRFQTFDAVMASIDKDKESLMHQLLHTYLLGDYLTMAINKHKTKT